MMMPSDCFHNPADIRNPQICCKKHTANRFFLMSGRVANACPHACASTSWGHALQPWHHHYTENGEVWQDKRVKKMLK